MLLLEILVYFQETRKYITHQCGVLIDRQQLATTTRKQIWAGKREREKFDDDNRVKNKNNNNSRKKFHFKQVKITLVYYMIQLFSKFQNNDLNK